MNDDAAQANCRGPVPGSYCAMSTVFPAVGQRSRILFRIGLFLSAIGLGLGSGLVLLAHPVFALGVWKDTQPMTIGLLVAASLCFLGVSARVGRSRLARRAVLHPATLLSLALAGWTVVVSPWSEKPWRSLFGTAQIGQGALWYLALAAFIAAAMMVRPTRRPWAAVLTIAAGTSLVAAVLGIQGLDWLYSWLVDHDLLPSVRLLHFNEYLAYPALMLVVGTLALWQEGRRRPALVLGLVAFVVLLLSRNRTVWLVLPVVFPLCFWLRGWLSAAQGRTRVLVGAVALAAIVPTVAIFMAGSSPLSSVHSLWSRFLIVQALMPSMTDGIGHVIAGRGWGAVPDELVRYLPNSGLDFYASAWGGLDRDIFHSHNALVEAMVSVGLPGLMMVLLLPATMVIGGRRRLLWLAAAFAISWAALDAFWFMVPANPPLIALAAATVIGRPRRTSLLRGLRPSIPTGAALTGALLTAGGGVLLTMQGVQESRLIAVLSSPESGDGLVLPLDLRGDGHGLAAILTAAVAESSNAGHGNAAQVAETLSALQAVAEQRDNISGSPVLSMALVNAVSTEAFAAPEAPVVERDDDGLSQAWARHLNRLLERAPQRIDAAAPYLNWLTIKGRTADLTAAIAALAAIDANHPVVLWFGGSLLLQSADPTRRIDGLNRMRQALRTGLERFMPVEDGVKAALGGGA